MWRPDGPVTAGFSVAATVQRVAERYPGRVAVVDVGGGRTSYRELVHQNQVDALAAALAPEVASHPNPAAAIAHRCDLALM